MPLFDFKCRTCGKEVEILVMGNERPICPECQGDDLQKLMASFAVRSGSRTSGTESKCSGCAGGSCSTCHS